MTELKNFPDNQTLSDLVKAIYEQLSNEIQNSDTYLQLSNMAIAHKNEGTGLYDNDHALLVNAKNIVRKEICPLSIFKPTYRNTENKYV